MEFIVEGLVIPVNTRLIVCVACEAGVVTTTRKAFAVGADVVRPVPAILSLERTSEEDENPVGAVHVPEAVVHT